MYKRILICSKCGLHYGTDKKEDNGICLCCKVKQIKETKDRLINEKL